MEPSCQPLLLFIPARPVFFFTPSLSSHTQTFSTGFAAPPVPAGRGPLHPSRQWPGQAESGPMAEAGWSMAARSRGPSADGRRPPRPSTTSEAAEELGPVVSLALAVKELAPSAGLASAPPTPISLCGGEKLRPRIDRTDAGG